jgi:hypothetical protein
MVAGAPNGPRASTGGGGSSRVHWSEARRSSVDEIEGEEEGVRWPLERQAVIVSTRGEGGSGAPRGGEDGGGPWLDRAMWGRMAWGGWQPASRAAGGGGGQSSVCRSSKGVGQRAWATHAGVGRTEKGGSWAEPESNSVDFDLKRISKPNTI